jgi:hypothetical protein
MFPRAAESWMWSWGYAGPELACSWKETICGASWETEGEEAFWFLELILIVLLVIGG